MKLANLKREIEKRGGTTKVRMHERHDGINYELTGELNGYDIELDYDGAGYFTTRRVTDRGHYDPGSDYNSGNYVFNHRIKDLDWACGLDTLPTQPVIHSTWKALVA